MVFIYVLGVVVCMVLALIILYYEAKFVHKRDEVIVKSSDVVGFVCLSLFSWLAVLLIIIGVAIELVKRKETWKIKVKI